MSEIYTSEKYKGYTINIYYDEYPENPRENYNIATFVCEHPSVSGDRKEIESEIEELFYKYVSEAELINYFLEVKGAELIKGDTGDYYEYQENKNSSNQYTVQIYNNDYIFDSLADVLSNAEKLDLAEKTGCMVTLPISIYEHSNIKVWLGSKSWHYDSQWDCSTIGFAYIDKDTASEAECVNVDSDEWKEWAYKVMESEMKEYSNYISGEVFRVEILDKYDETVDECSGFYYGIDGVNELIEESKEIVDKIITEKYKEMNDKLVPWAFDEKHFLSDSLEDFMNEICDTNGITCGKGRGKRMISGYVKHEGAEKDSILTLEYSGNHKVSLLSFDKQTAIYAYKKFKKMVERDFTEDGDNHPFVCMASPVFTDVDGTNCVIVCSVYRESDDTVE